MKFSDGYWQMRKGVEFFPPMELRASRIEGDKMTLFGPTRRINGRGDVLNLPLITMEVSSPGRDIIKVRLYHHKGVNDPGPFFELNKNARDFSLSERDVCSLKTGDLEFRMKKGEEWHTEFFYKDDKLTGSPLKGAGYLRTPEGEPFFREQLTLDVGETIYGLGERFTPFVKNGQVVDIWNEDGGTGSELAYKNIPFYISSRGYGIFVNHPEKVSFEAASETVSRMQFSVPGESLEYFVIGGDDLKEVLSNYTALTGRPALPPAWSFGLWLTTSFTTSYDEETVTSFIDGMTERDIPLQVFHFDCYWMKEFRWCDFEWDSDVFPDPEAMLARLHARGLKTCLWINPYIAQNSALFDEGAREGYFLKRPDGSVWQWDMWQAGMALVDFTNPDASAWFTGKLRDLIRQGADCFKTDFGERIPTDVVYHDGSDPVKMHNYYTYLYNKAVFELLKDEKGEGEALLFARSATAGGQKFPVHWGGDCAATYPSMAESLRGGLSLCLSGFGFWSHDISGFEQTATPDLYKRWAAFGLLSTHSRLHGSTSYRVPWNFDEESVDVLRYFTKLKNRLMPYLFKSAAETSRTGVPMMRAMILEFPEDPSCAYLDRQYMLGENLLVAPVFNDRGEVTYYLPEGRWISLIDGTGRTGGRWYKETYDYRGLPLFMRQGAVIPMGDKGDRTEYDYARGAEFHVTPLDEGQEATSEIINPDGDTALILSVRREGDKLFYRGSGSSESYALIYHDFDGKGEVKLFRSDQYGKKEGEIPLS